jgi:asparagine synthase (glutamine-hydrolysing)
VKLANLGTKTLLKRAMAPLLPAAAIRRRKHAFQIPLDQWIAGPLRDFVRDTLLDKKARERGWIDTGRLETLLGTNGNRPQIDGQSVWTLMSLELWARAFLDAH